MNFEEILPLLKKGERAYREKDFHYSVPSYIYFEDGEIMRQYMNGVNPCKSYVSYGDIVADDWEIYVEKEKLPDRETCNPKICKWCKYSSNGMRNAGRSITMCDGCRYNEEFEHITEDRIQ